VRGWPRGVGPGRAVGWSRCSSDARTGPATDQARRPSLRPQGGVRSARGRSSCSSAWRSPSHSGSGSSARSVVRPVRRPGRVTPTHYLPTQARRSGTVRVTADGGSTAGGDPALLRQLVRAVPGRDPGPAATVRNQPAAVATGWRRSGSRERPAGRRYVLRALGGGDVPCRRRRTFQVTSGLFYFTGLPEAVAVEANGTIKGHPLRRALDGRVRGLAARPGHVGHVSGLAAYSQRKVSAAATGAATAQRASTTQRLERDRPRRAERAVEAVESAAAGRRRATSARPDGSLARGTIMPRGAAARGRDRWRRPGGGVLGQAVLGGIVVYTKLKPVPGDGPLPLSILVLVDAVVLVHRSSRVYDTGSGTLLVPRPVLLLGRGLVVLVAIVLAAGTATTGAGPHAGGSSGQLWPSACPSRCETCRAPLERRPPLGGRRALPRGRPPCHRRPRARAADGACVLLRAGGPGGHWLYPVLHAPARAALELHVIGAVSIAIGTTRFFLGFTHHPLEATPVRSSTPDETQCRRGHRTRCR